MLPEFRDTIIACSSGGQINSAIGVIRLSGSLSLSIAKDILNSSTEITPNRMYYRDLKIDGQVIDQICLCFFRSPHSFTGEDILELFVHGNTLNISRIIDSLKLKYGLRDATAGEFSLRALKNKKLSLSQVEGLDLLLNANSYQVLSSGVKTLTGQLDSDYQALRELFIRLKCNLDILCDFSDDVGEENAWKNYSDSLREFKFSVEKLALRAELGSSDYLTPKIVLYGKPNAGKSTFFNSLISKKRSLTSSQEGTTRDYISENIVWKGVSFQVTDTAGLRATQDSIESEGIELAKEELNKSFFKIEVVDIGKAQQFKSSDFQPDLLIFTKFDRHEIAEKFNVEGVSGPFCFFGLEKNGPIEPSYKIGPIEPNFRAGPMGPSSKPGPIEPEFNNGPMGPENYSKLLKYKGDVSEILDLAVAKYQKTANAEPIPLARHLSILKRLKDSTFSLVELGQDDVGILSSELFVLDELISELIGVTTPDEVLHSIFSRFCIGK